MYSSCTSKMHVTKPNACSYRIGNLYFSRTVNLQLDIRIFCCWNVGYKHYKKKTIKKCIGSVCWKNRMYSANEEQVLIAVSSIFLQQNIHTLFWKWISDFVDTQVLSRTFSVELSNTHTPKSKCFSCTASLRNRLRETK